MNTNLTINLKFILRFYLLQGKCNSSHFLQILCFIFPVLSGSSWPFGDQENLWHLLSFTNPSPENSEAHLHKQVCMESYRIQRHHKTHGSVPMGVTDAASYPCDLAQDIPRRESCLKQGMGQDTPVLWGRERHYTHHNSFQTTSQSMSPYHVSFQPIRIFNFFAVFRFYQ